MGVEKVEVVTDEKQMQQFVWHLLRDVKALEQMLEKNMFETTLL